MHDARRSGHGSEARRALGLTRLSRGCPVVRVEREAVVRQCAKTIGPILPDDPRVAVVPPQRKTQAWV